MTTKETNRTLYIISILLLTFFVNCGIIYFYFTAIKQNAWYNEEKIRVVCNNSLERNEQNGNIESKKFV